MIRRWIPVFLGIFFLSIFVNCTSFSSFNDVVFPKILRPRALNVSTKIVCLTDAPQEYIWLYEGLKKGVNGKPDILTVYVDEFFRVTHEPQWRDDDDVIPTIFRNSSLDGVLSKDSCWDSVLMDKLFSDLLDSMGIPVVPVIILWAPGIEKRPTSDVYCDNNEEQANPFLKTFFEGLKPVKPQYPVSIGSEDTNSVNVGRLNGSKVDISMRKKYGNVSCSDVLNQQPPANFFGLVYPYVVLNFRALYRYFQSLIYCSIDDPRDSISGTLGDSAMLFNNELNVNATALGLRKEIQKYYMGKYCTGKNRFNYSQFCRQLLGEELTLRLYGLHDEPQSIHVSEESKKQAQISTIKYGMSYVKSYLDLNLLGFTGAQRDTAVFETPVPIQFCVILDGNSHLDEISSYLRSISQDFLKLGIPFRHSIRYIYLRDDPFFYNAYVASLENQSNLSEISLTRLTSALVHLTKDGYYSGKLFVMIGLCPDFCWTSSETTVRVHPNLIVSLYNSRNQYWQTSLLFTISSALCGLTSSEVESFYGTVRDVHGQPWLNLLCDRLASLSRLRHGLIQLDRTRETMIPSHVSFANSSELFQMASILVEELDSFELSFPSLNRTFPILSRIKTLEVLMQNVNSSGISEKHETRVSMWISIPSVLVFFSLAIFMIHWKRRRTRNALHLKLP